MVDLAEKLAGRFIVIDGGDGVGKSTQVHALAEFLRGQGVALRQVRDPGGTAIGEKIRRILLDKRHGEMAIRCELMLYMASRAQLAAEVIAPALAEGQCVLGDRYISSTVAYQGAGGIDVEDVLAAGRLAVGQTWPDLTIILDLPVEAGLARLSGPVDRMEAKDLAFHRRVRELFLQQAESQPDRFAVVDATGGVDEVQQRIRAVIADRLGG